MVDRDRWDRQKGESRKAYEAFSIYRDLGPSRSIAKVAEKLGKSKSLLERWSRKWNWVERTEQYDEYQDRMYRLEQEEKRKEMAERHARQAKMFQNKVVQRLQTLEPSQLSATELVRWFDTAVKVERLSLGESTDIAEVEHNGQVTERHEYDITQRIVSDPESRELARQLFRRTVEKNMGDGRKE